MGFRGGGELWVEGEWKKQEPLEEGHLKEGRALRRDHNGSSISGHLGEHSVEDNYLHKKWNFTG